MENRSRLRLQDKQKYRVRAKRGVWYVRMYKRIHVLNYKFGIRLIKVFYRGKNVPE